jgi:hypothetical protein
MDLAQEKRRLTRAFKDSRKPEAVQCQMVSMANLVVRRQKELQ